MFGQTFESIMTPAEIAELEGIARELSVQSAYSIAWCVDVVKHLVLAGYDVDAIRNAVPTLLTCWHGRNTWGGLI